ncbi:MAG: PAS domain S-box protein [Elusimicrobiota bacterium]|nr:MAG: PAS domain S-box protein [Elusimicrobiota bacterium]
MQRAVLVLGGVAGLVLFLFLRRLLAPVALLAAATERIRDGEYRVEVPVTTDDEIGALARNFNEMSRELGNTTVSKDFLNDILDSIQDQVIVTDAEGRVVLVNPAAAQLLGRTKAELLGRPAAELVEGEGASFSAPSRSVPALLAAKSGEKIPVLFSSSPIKAADGRVTGWIGAAKDVTELRKLEARMRQSEKLSAVGQLAAGVAHEINNPLGVILGFAQTMARSLAPGAADELPVRSIEREALRCKALVQNLLTFSRASQADRGPTDLNAAVEQSLALIAPQAKLNNVAVSAALGEGLPPILGNKNQLEQVILNLAKNAIDAMPAGAAGADDRAGGRRLLGAPARRRRRDRHPRRDAVEDLRPVLHDQARRPGHGPGTEPRQRDRPEALRRDHGREPARSDRVHRAPSPRLSEN